jgi:type II secretory pathway pseudopilin PulG
VVIIIGILMGIAVPVYLNQRVGAQDAAQANLRQGATAEQAYRTANNGYTAVAADLRPFGFNQGVPVVNFIAGADTFCASVTSQSGKQYHMSQDDGTPVVGSLVCP